MVHEWALAEAVLETVTKLANENKIGSIKKVYLSIGELQSIDIDSFKFALNTLKNDLNISINEFIFEYEKARFKCIKCGYEWDLNDIMIKDEEIKEAIHFLPEVVHAFIKCPKCRSQDYKVVSGRGIIIKRIEGFS